MRNESLNQGEASGRGAELSKLRSQMKETQDQLHNTRQRLEHVVNERQPLLDNRRQATSSTATEVQRLQRRVVEQQQSIEAERQVWHEEKATVLVYQRHLQQQYVQAMKRNQQLEEALGLLGITGVPSLENSLPKSNQSSMSSPKSTCSSSDPNPIDLDSLSSSSNGETPC